MAESASTLLPKLNEWLKQQNVSARVVIKGKDTLEVRMESQDLMSEMFEVKKKRPVVKTHATIRPTPAPKAPKPKEEPVHKGFNFKIPTHADGMSNTELSELHELTRNYPFLSATKLDSKVWDATCREVVWLSADLFADSHRWDKAWLSKTEQKGSGPQIVRGKFDSIAKVIDSIKECLDYVADAHEKRGYWWPTLENGKIPRKSLASFLCTATKSGTEWSPFCEVMWEMNKDEAVKTALPKLAVSVAENLIKESPYLNSMPASSMGTYWMGVKKYVDWYYSNRDKLMTVVENRVRMADIGMAVTLVKEWNASASGRALPLTFIYPGCDKWFRFCQWCKTNRNVVIPDYRNAG